MSFQPIAKRIASIFRTATRGLPGVEGNILVYIVMVMLIFGVLWGDDGHPFQHLHHGHG